MIKHQQQGRKETIQSIDNNSPSKKQHKGNVTNTKIIMKSHNTDSNVSTKNTTSNNNYFVNSKIDRNKYVPTGAVSLTTNNDGSSAVTNNEIIEDQKHLLPFSLIQNIAHKSKKRKQNPLTTGSISSGGSGRSCKSSSSGLISLGNTSFGFNFDECEGEFGLPSSEEPLADSDEIDYNVGKMPKEASKYKRKRTKSMTSTDACRLTQKNLAACNKSRTNSHASPSSSPSSQEEAQEGTISSLTSNPSTASKASSTNQATKDETSSNVDEAASAAMEQMAFVTEKYLNPKQRSNNNSVEKKKTRFVESAAAISPTINITESIAKNTASSQPEDDDVDTEDGYDTDVDAEGQKNEAQLSTSGPASSAHKKSKKKNMKREERNAREKERSYRISKKINELRTLLSNGGVIVPKGTKSSVLTEAVNYIRMLESYLRRSEMERQQLTQQVQMVSNGCFGVDAAYTMKQVATRNGIFPPNDQNSTRTQQPANATQVKTTQQQQQHPWNMLDMDNMNEHEYRSIFLSCPVGIGIASLGGAFIDCNLLFCKLSQYTKEEICTMTIFNLTNKCDLHNAFQKISVMIESDLSRKKNPSKQNNFNGDKSVSSPIILRGLMKHRDDLGLSVSLIKNSEGTAKCFCVTLMKNIMNDSSSKNLPAMIMDCQQQNFNEMEKKIPCLRKEHAYTTG